MCVSTRVMRLMGMVVLFSMLAIGGGQVVLADTNTSQAALIQKLLVMIQQLQAQLQLLGTTNVATPQSACTSITHLLTIGSTDAVTGGDVTRLQKFLAAKGYFTYGAPTGYFGQATLNAVRLWQDTEHFYEPYGNPAGRGVVSTRSWEKIAESCTSTTIDQQSVTSVGNSFTLSGTASDAKSIFVAIVPHYQTGETDWRSVYTTGSYVAFTGDTVNKVVNGKWSVQFTGLRGDTYEARVYDNSNPTTQRLLLSQTLTVTAPEVINFTVGSSPKTITIGEHQKATDGGISISPYDVFLTNGLTGSPRTTFAIEPKGFTASTASAGLGEYAGSYTDSAAPNGTIRIKVVDMSQSMNTVTISVEDPGPKG